MKDTDRENKPEPAPADPSSLVTRRISLAGQAVALWASGVEVLNANVSERGETKLEIDDDPLFAGFIDHMMTPDDPLPAIRDHVSRVDRMAAFGMLFAQCRAILAGNAALDYSDITGEAKITDVAMWNENESWCDNLLFAYAELLDIDDDTCQALWEKVWGEACSIASANWALVSRNYHAVTHKFKSLLNNTALLDSRASTRFPITTDQVGMAVGEAEAYMLESVWEPDA